MQYQDYYNLIQPTSMYDTVKAAQQDRLVNQENQLIMQQKQFAFNKQKATSAYKTLSAFKKLTPEQQAAQWTQTRQTLESIYPEKRGAFPSSWDLDPQGNARELDTFLSGISQLVEPERVTIREGEVIQERMPGGEFKTILEGPKKPEKSIFGEEKITLPDGSQMMVDTVDLPSGSRQVGDFVKVRNKPNTKIPADQYYREHPEDWPYLGENPYSQKKPINSLAVPPTAPMDVPGQIELPPRQFNVPSPTNRAGETNQGYGIDENAMLQQPQIMPSMGNMMLKGADAVMADEYAPQPRNALVGGMMQPPSQFAELLPAGSAPNRFGSPGVEGMEFAATGGYKQEVVPGGMRFSGPPKPVARDEKPVFRALTSQEIIKEGQNPDLVTGRISQFGEIQWKDKKTQEQIKSESAQAQSATSQAYVNTGGAMKLRADKLTVLRGLKRYRKVLNELGEKAIADTGPIDQIYTRFTDLGSELDGLRESVGEQLLAAFKVPGDPANAEELELKKNQLPNTGRRLYQNFNNLNMLEEYILTQVGVQAMISSDAEWKALPPNTKYIDLRDGTPRIRRALPGEQVK